MTHEDEVTALLRAHFIDEERRRLVADASKDSCSLDDIRRLARNALRKGHAEEPRRTEESLETELISLEVDAAETREGGIESAFVPPLSPAEATWVDRMHRQTHAKLALAVAVRREFEDQENRRVFIEGGSTTGLAALGVARNPGASLSQRARIHLTTNMLKIFEAFSNLPDVSPRLLYADSKDGEYSRKYGECFPFTEADVCLAVRLFGSQDERVLRRLKSIRVAWRQMLSDAWDCDATIMTASRMHLGVGLFVGSLSNALTKEAFLACSRRLCLLIDGSKIIRNADLVHEWENAGCCPLFSTWLAGASSQRVDRLLDGALAHVDPARDESDTIWAAANRDPSFRLRLTGEIMDMHDSRTTQEVAMPCSWWDCVEMILRRSGGKVSVFVSQPEGASTRAFEDHLRGAIQEANDFFAKVDGMKDGSIDPGQRDWRRCKVRISGDRVARVNVNVGPYRIPNAPQMAEVVVWECPMTLVDENARDAHVDRLPLDVAGGR